MSGRLYAFSDTARHAWDLLEAGASREDLVGDFARTWDLSPATARDDIASILERWHRLALVALPGTDDRAAPAALAAEDNGRFDPEPCEPLVWTCTIQGRAFRFSVEGDLGATLLALFEPMLTPGAEPEVRLEIRRGARGWFALFDNDTERLRTPHATLLAGALWQAVLERVHPGVEWLALIHGAAAGRDGAAVGLCGRSGAGKSTLVAALAAHGFDYLADDMIPLSAPHGDVVPLPLPLSIKPGSLDILATWHPRLGSTEVYRTKGVEARLLAPPADAWATPPMAMTTLVFPRFEGGASARSRRLTTFEALTMLLAERIWLSHPMTERRIQAFVDWLAATPCHAITYGTLEASVRLVDEIIA